MSTWAGRDVYQLELETGWLTWAGVSTIINRRILTHAEMYASNPRDLVSNLRRASGVICGLGDADILMGNWNPLKSLQLLFPAGKADAFIEFLREKEGYQIHRQSCSESGRRKTVLISDALEFRIRITESESPDALLPAEDFTNTCSCVFVGPFWYRLAYPDLFRLRLCLEMESEVRPSPTGDERDEWEARGFRWLENDNFERRRGGYKGLSRDLDPNANVEFPIDSRKVL
jgi:hypothetical protein